jgi:hypothetical protein
MRSIGMQCQASGYYSHPRRHLVLVAMIFAVAMTFIDQTIVAIAAPELQKDLELSENGVLRIG